MNVTEIRVVDCVPFENYPFKIQDNSDMEMLIDSIKESGVLIPIVVRPKGKEYEKETFDLRGGSICRPFPFLRRYAGKRVCRPKAERRSLP